MPTFKITEEVKQEITLYKQFMREHEYTELSLIGYSTYLSRFLRSSSRENTRTLQKNIADFLDSECENSPQTYKYCRAALYLYFKIVEGRSYPKHRLKENIPEIETILTHFYDYSVNIKELKSDSATWEVSYIRKFLEYIITSCRLDDITAYEIREFVINRLAHLRDSSKGRIITAIRNFFRFRKFEGQSVHESVFLLPLSPAVWGNSAFPKTMDEQVFNCLYEIPNADTPTEKRDRCIILCFTELAFRCIEVAGLTIDDFNWRESYVTIKNTKNHSDRKLPISEKLSQAVIEYLKTARPQTTSRILFVRFKHKCGEPMGCSQIRGVVRRIYAKTNADVKSTGTHILRKTAATKIYNAGNSLKMTADILGHESLDSTVRYTKTDIASLHSVVCSWPMKVEKAGDGNAE